MYEREKEKEREREGERERRNYVMPQLHLPWCRYIQTVIDERINEGNTTILQFFIHETHLLETDNSRENPITKKRLTFYLYSLVLSSYLSFCWVQRKLRERWP